MVILFYIYHLFVHCEIASSIVDDWPCRALASGQSGPGSKSNKTYYPFPPKLQNWSLTTSWLSDIHRVHFVFLSGVGASPSEVQSLYATAPCRQGGLKSVFLINFDLIGIIRYFFLVWESALYPVKKKKHTKNQGSEYVFFSLSLSLSLSLSVSLTLCLSLPSLPQSLSLKRLSLSLSDLSGEISVKKCLSLSL